MNYGDLSSIVQLGVGLHLGTALLQLYGELGLQSMNRSIDRINELQEAHSEKITEHHEEIEEVDLEYRLFKIKLANEYKKYVVMNAVVAFVLALILVYISFNSLMPASEMASIWIVALSLIPAPILLSVFWWDASKSVSPLKAKIDKLENDLLRKSGI